MALISHADSASFQKLRERIFSLIKKATEEFNGGYKFHEGQLSIEFPGYYEQSGTTTICLYCHVLGTGKHHYWSGRTMKDALDMAWVDVKRWEGN